MKCVKTILETFLILHQIDPINRERSTAALVDFCHKNFKCRGKLPQVIPNLLREPDFKISAMCSTYSDLRYWILYTVQSERCLDTPAPRL